MAGYSRSSVASNQIDRPSSQCAMQHPLAKNANSSTHARRRALQSLTSSARKHRLPLGSGLSVTSAGQLVGLPSAQDVEQGKLIVTVSARDGRSNCLLTTVNLSSVILYRLYCNAKFRKIQRRIRIVDCWHISLALFYGKQNMLLGVRVVYDRIVYIPHTMVAFPYVEAERLTCLCSSR